MFGTGHRLILAAGCLLLSWLISLPAVALSADDRPNIIVIFSDDVGAETIGVYGGESYETPQLDALARDGVYFDHGHAQPLCTPSRVKLMTGRYNYRNYSHFGYLDPGERTFAHMLKDAGYSTFVAGKWQLYSNPFEQLQGATPRSAGFDEYHLWQLYPERKKSRFWAPLINHNGEVTQHEESVFGPDVFNDKVLDYIESHRDSPFFIYYPMVLAHDPWVTTPDMRDESRSDQDKFGAMMAYMDKMVGKVRARVVEQGLEDRTVIFFIGDNGTGRDIVSQYRGQQVRGAKAETINAGTRVPFIAWGPRFVRSDGLRTSLVNLNDIMPTLAELAGIALPLDNPQDGMSLLPVLRDGSELARESMLIHYDPRWPSGKPARYAFDRRWKLYQRGDFFDTQEDPLEQNPLRRSELSGDALAAFDKLTQHLERDPGELESTQRWIPAKAYYYLAAILASLLVSAWLIWHFWRRRRSALPQ